MVHIRRQRRERLAEGARIQEFREQSHVIPIPKVGMEAAAYHVIAVAPVGESQIGFPHVAVPETSPQGQKEVVAKLDALYWIENIGFISRFFQIMEIHVEGRRSHQRVRRVGEYRRCITLVSADMVRERVISGARWGDGKHAGTRRGGNRRLLRPLELSGNACGWALR